MGQSMVRRAGAVILFALFSATMVQAAGLERVAVNAQQLDFARRELQAPPAVKQRLQTLRQEITAKHLTFTVGYTEALDLPLEKLAGLRPPVNAQDLAKRATVIGLELDNADKLAMQEFVKIKNIQLPEAQLQCMATLAAWDFRKISKVTPVKNQMGCGSCWDFGACGALESSYLIRNNQTIDVSEQQILSCAGIGTCEGSWYTGVFDYMISQGAGKEADYPYVGGDAPCKGAIAMPYRAVAQGAVHPEAAIPSVAQIKEGLCQYGPLAIGVLVRDGFHAYTGGVLNDGAVPLTVVGSDGKTYYNVNHCVLLIGWDDSKGAWLIKNSWGTNWGSTCEYGTERGYIWIKYGNDNVGLLPGWVRAKNVAYTLDPSRLRKYYPRFVPFPPDELQKLQPLQLRR